MKICVIGAFGFDDLANATGGQPVKTRELYRALQDKYGRESVSYVETYGWKRRPVTMLKQLLSSVSKSDVLIMLPAHNGLKVFSRLLLALKNKKAKLFYDVIGGWLPSIAEKDPKLLENLKKLDGIWVETTSMKNGLNALGLSQVTVVPNFKALDVMVPEQLPLSAQEPYRLCTFSRVMEEKGITDAIEAVSRVNAQLGRQVYALDIYGPVAPQYQEAFEQLQAQHADFVRYQGVAAPGDSVKILKDYFALLFPTYYYGEGFAGTLLDAMASGLPVVASDWRYNSELVEEGCTGTLYPTRDVDSLTERLTSIQRDPNNWLALRKNCLEKAKQYSPETVTQQIARLIEE